MIEKPAAHVPTEGDAGRALVLLSGGIDSAVALAWAQQQRWKVRPIYFTYAGRPRREMEAMRNVSRAAGLPPPSEIDVPQLRMTGPPRRPEPGSGAAGLPAAYIPHRNLVFYALALVTAAEDRAQWIVGGHLKVDGAAFRDARAPYFEALNALVAQGTPEALGEPCRIVLPLIAMTKEECLREGLRLKVRLDLTWSCCLDGVSHCGTCVGCVERRLGMRQAGIEDRTVYTEALPAARA